jgi:hypothetical protein
MYHGTFELPQTNHHHTVFVILLRAVGENPMASEMLSYVFPLRLMICWNGTEYIAGIRVAGRELSNSVRYEGFRHSLVLRTAMFVVALAWG